MRFSRGFFRWRFRRSSLKDGLSTPLTTNPEEEEAIIEEETATAEDVAAIKIQAAFRGHLARRAFRAIRSLVKLQALVRGAYVRKQTGIALHCMHALVRLQVRVRTRQLLSNCSEGC